MRREWSKPQDLRGSVSRIECLGGDRGPMTPLSLLVETGGGPRMTKKKRPGGGDFARGERTKPTPDEGPDFARGERKTHD